MVGFEDIPAVFAPEFAVLSPLGKEEEANPNPSISNIY
jgi:hypothetical protein